MPSKRKIRHDIRSTYQSMLHALTTAQFWQGKLTDRAQAEYSTLTTDLQTVLENELQRSHRSYTRSIDAAQRKIQHATHALGIHAVDWMDSRWRTYEPILHQQTQSDINQDWQLPYILRLGNIRHQYGVVLNDTTAFAPFIGHGHIIIESNDYGREQALSLLQNLLTRIVIFAPVLSTRLVMLDPLAVGDTFPFKRLPESIRGQTVYTETHEIRDQMQELIEHLRRVTTTYLSSDYDTIEDYNVDAGAIVEPYRVLAVADFPTRFDNEAITRLISLAQKGVKTGIYLLIHVNRDTRLPPDVNLRALYETATLIRLEKQSFSVRMGNITHAFTPDRLLDSTIFNQIMDRISEKADEGGFQGIAFDRIQSQAGARSFWNTEATERVEVPIGLSGARDKLLFWVGNKSGRNASHALVGGRTGSGKSTFFHVLINAVSTTYSPEEVELYLIDFKEGVEFKPYADHALPHARVIGIESEREFGVSVLRAIQKELMQRGQLFKDANAQDIITYRTRTGRSLPRILLVIDEFQILFAEQDALTTEIASIIEDVARRGRSFGIHMVLGSQSVRVSELDSKVYDQFGVRIVLQSSEQEAAALLDANNVTAVRTLERPGEVIYNDGGGLREFNSPGQIAFLSNEEIVDSLSSIQQHAAQINFKRQRPLVVFNGGNDADIADNTHLRNLYTEKDYPPHSYLKQRLNLRDWAASEFPTLLWVGEAVEIKPHTAVPMRRRDRSNLIIVGDNEQVVVGMLSVGLVSLMGQLPPKQLAFYVIDLSLAETAWEHTFKLLKQHFPHDIKITDRRRAEKMIAAIYGVVERRQQRYDAGEQISDPTIVFVIVGAHRLPKLRPIPGAYGGTEQSEHGKQLTTIIQRGPEVGVHVLCWYDRFMTFDKQLERRTLGYFDCRIALPMNEDDSATFINSTAAGRLKDNKHLALLYNEENNQQIEKFKPYALPASPRQASRILQAFGQQLHKRNGAK